MASNNGGGGKEERRRRIAERGSDRMALITGRINALPPTPPTTTSSHHPARHAQSMSVSAFDSHSDNHDLPPRLVRPHSLSSSAFNVEYQEDQTGSCSYLNSHFLIFVCWIDWHVWISKYDYTLHFYYAKLQVCTDYIDWCITLLFPNGKIPLIWFAFVAYSRMKWKR